MLDDKPKSIDDYFSFLDAKFRAYVMGNAKGR